MKNGRRKRLCMMIPGHWSQVMGGSQYQAKCIIEELQKTGKYEIFYVTRSSDPKYQAHGYHLIPYGYPGAHRQGSHRFILESFMLPRILNQIHPDIIYQRVGCAQTGIAARYALRRGCKMVWHIASEYDLESPGLAVSRLLMYRWLDRYALNYGIRHATNIIAQTHDQKRLLEKYFQRTPTAVIPNFHPAPSETLSKENPVTVVWVANLKSSKQPEIFIRLADDLRNLPNTRFLMVGAIQGGGMGRQKYMDLIEQVPGLEYAGPKSQETVNEILSKSHIFVNTSKREGFPNTFIQAWLRKVPVVSLDVDPDRLIDRHRLGFVSKSFERLKNDVTLLAENQGLREQFGESARNFAAQYFSNRNIVDMINIFDEPI